MRTRDLRAPRARRRALPALVLALVPAACGGAREPDPPADTRPSIVLVLIDTLRRDHLSLYGYERATSPGLDALAREALVFDRCMAPSSWTKPSTVSLLTGLYPARHGVHDRRNVAPEELEFLAEALRDEGYETVAFSGNVNASPIFGLDQGFEEFDFSGTREAHDYPDVEDLLDAARDWLERRSERPFFLYLHVMNVHGPYKAPEAYAARFRPEGTRAFPFQNDLWRAIVLDGAIERRAEVDEAGLRDLRARYDGAIAYTDERLCAFFGELDEQGVLDDAVLAITSDHGEELFDHGGFGHGYTLYEEVLGVPLIVRLPGGAGGGRRVEEEVCLIDLPATLLDLARAGRGMGDGRTLAPLLAGSGAWEERDLLAQLVRERKGAAFSVRRWPLETIEIESDYAGRQGVIELYDRAADPREQRDLSGSPTPEFRALHARGEEALRALEARAAAQEELELDAELEEQLRVLGYVR